MHPEDVSLDDIYTITSKTAELCVIGHVQRQSRFSADVVFMQAYIDIIQI